jgi:hypothetical protein
VGISLKSCCGFFSDNKTQCAVEKRRIEIKRLKYIKTTYLMLLFLFIRKERCLMDYAGVGTDFKSFFEFFDLKFKNEIFYHEFKKSKIKYLNNFSPAP